MTRQTNSEGLLVRREIEEALLSASASLETSLEAIEMLERLPKLSKRERLALHCLRHLYDDKDILAGDEGAQDYQRNLLRKLARGEKV